MKVSHKEAGFSPRMTDKSRFKLNGNWLSPEVTKDELDALTCAIVAREDLGGNTIAIGDPEEGLMVLPRK